MLTAPLHHPNIADHFQVSLLPECSATMAGQAEPADLVEWEMSAVQVGSLVAAMAIVFGVVSLFA